MTTAEQPALRWQTPPLVREHAGSDTQLSEAMLLELESLRQQAREDGLEAGRAEAFAAHQASMQEQLEQFGQLLAAITRPYEELTEAVAEDLARLAGKIAQQLVRRELKTSPDAIMGVVREAIDCLPQERDGIKVYLNDKDAELLREMSQLATPDRNWDILNDPTIKRGDCLVTMGTSLVDACLEARVNTIMATLLGGEREEDSGS
jgi:flagellar assembly protein FliH